MAVYRLQDRLPQIGPGAWVAPGAQVIGRVTLGARTSVWFGAVVRGDNDSIVIGDDTNIQDGAVLHTDDGIPLTVGERVTIGHQAMLHGCTVGDGSLIGIQAVVLNNAVIGRECLVGAGALVTEGKSFPDGVLIIGSPAKMARALTAEERQSLRKAAAHYVARSDLFRNQLQIID
jgi:carbonic anhydrase/acetyltransferase-like protein (isoleucine patch superfamily)